VRFYGKEKQDRFAYYLIGKTGTFLDIGCYHPTQWNNTKALEEAGWKGLMFDIREKWVSLCQQNRTSKVFCVDVSTDEFSDILKENLKKPVVDYISLDADDGSLGALQQLLDNGFSFKCMTFEHDYYDKGNALKAPSKALLEAHGYFPLFEDVKLVDGKIWEDWWINPTCFPAELKSIACKETAFEDCILKVMEFNDGNR
tara:strand:- start:347 stop:946 length:600 start_codon:yes stop_codon:yes gene_type:complete